MIERRQHRVTINIEFDEPLSRVLDVLDRLNAFLREVRTQQIAVDCQVVVKPIGLLSPAIAAAIAEAEGEGADQG